MTATRRDDPVRSGDSGPGARPSCPIEVTHPRSDDVDQPLLHLVASVEPGVVFTSLAAQCVPEFCDDCIIDIIDRTGDGTDVRYRIVYPPRSGPKTGGLARLADRAAAAADHRVHVRFTHPRPGVGHHSEAAEAEARHGFHGAATFVWHRRTPTRADRAMATVLVEHAVHIVVWQRSEQAAHAAAANAANLQLALQTSRHIGAAIGILMSLHKITEDQAFDLLRLASQRCNRKLRDLALDVIDTGWLDPALVTGTP